MGKSILKFIILCSLVVVFTGCGAKSKITQPAKEINQGDTDWQYAKTIEQPLAAQSSATSLVTIGDLTANQASLSLSQGIFDTPTEVKIATPQSVPKYFGTQVEMLGAPLEITSGDQPVRLNDKAVISFKINPTLIPSDKSFLKVVYFDGQQWEYLNPTSIDSDSGLITFETYHFSLFGTTKIKDETELIKKWSHSEALDKALRDNINTVTDHVASQIIDLTLEKMGLEENSIKTKILADLLKEDGYREIIDEATKGGGEFDMIALNQKIALLAGKKISEIVDESTLQKGLSNLTESAEDVAAVSKAAANIAEGNYKDAAKIIGETIADKFVLTTAGKIAVEMVEYQIDSWRNEEVEAAYKAFKNGANAKFWGYNNDAGDFDTVWDQMNGASRQLVIEAIRRENQVRAESGMDKLSAKQEDIIRNNVKENYRKQFVDRSKEEDKINAEQTKLETLMKAFKDANFFDSTFAPTGMQKGFEFNSKMDILMHFAQKMMKDTGRGEFIDLKGIRPDKKLLISDIISAAQYYFDEPGGRTKYYEYLKKEFNLEFFPELKELSGTLTGTLVITDVKVPEGWQAGQKPAGSSDESGCDFSIDPRQFIGKQMAMKITLSPTGESSGKMTFALNDGDVKTTSFTYEAGILKASYSEKGASGVFNLVAFETETSYSLNGSFNIDYGQGTFKIISNVAVSKAIPVKAPATK